MTVTFLLDFIDMYSRIVSSAREPLRASSPDFSLISPDELDQLEIVLRKQVSIENEQKQRLAGLRRTMFLLRQTIENGQQRAQALSSSSSHNFSSAQCNSSIRPSSYMVQCYTCLSTVEVETNDLSLSQSILCADCHQPVCRRCGNYTSPELIQSHFTINSENKSCASKWRCRMCIIRREFVRKSGRQLNRENSNK